MLISQVRVCFNFQVNQIDSQEYMVREHVIHVCNCVKKIISEYKNIFRIPTVFILYGGGGKGNNTAMQRFYLTSK